MDNFDGFAHSGLQLLIWDMRQDGLPCLGYTLDLVSGRLWFASEKRYYPGEVTEFSIRMGWKRRICCTLKVAGIGEELAGDFAYIGEFVEINPVDFQELASVFHRDRSELVCDAEMDGRPASVTSYHAAA
jgi:hypothetical protein